MKILVLSWRDPKHPLAGGAEQVMHEHMKGWISSHNQVTLFTSYFKNAKRFEVLDGVSIYRYGYQILGVHILAFFWYFFFSKQQFDLVIDQFHGIPFFTPLYIRNKKIAVLQEVAKEVWLKNHLTRPLNLIVGAIGYILEPFFFKIYKKTPFMVGSNSAKNDLINFGIAPTNISIVPHGVLVYKLKNKPKKDTISTILFLGALAKDKGIEDALCTFSKLSKNGKYHFWIVGKGPATYTNYLKQMVIKLGIFDNTKFWGFVSEKQKFELLAKAHILINPSSREGWGLVNIEANSMGVPVIAYNNVGLIDSVKDGFSGIICKENNPDNMADNVIKLISDDKRYKELSANAKVWSGQFSWKKSTHLSLNLIKKVCGVS